MHTILKWLALAITAGVAIFIILFLLHINKTENASMHSNMKLLASKPINEEQEKSWLSRFSDDAPKGYFYPVNEIYVDVKLSDKLVVKTIYKLIAHISNPYQFFCLQEELRQNHVKYYLNNKNNEVELLVYSSDKEELTSFVNTLKHYKIKAVVLPYKEEKTWKKVQS
jgi:hypothetical protein